MSGSFTSALQTSLLNHTFRHVAYASPAAVYAALADPTGLTELTGAGYPRQAIPFGAPAGSTRTVRNSAIVQWPPAGVVIGDVGVVKIMDAATSGVVLAFGPLVDANGLPTSLHIGLGTVFQFAIGALVVGFAAVPPPDAIMASSSLTVSGSARLVQGHMMSAAGELLWPAIASTPAVWSDLTDDTAWLRYPNSAGEMFP